METSVKNRLFKTVAIVFALLFCQAVFAASYPDKPIRLIVPFGPGQAADVGARIIAQQLSTLLKTPVVVENHPGAGGNIATSMVVNAKTDGYTMLVGSTATQIINPAIYPSLGFKPDSLTPVAYTGWTPFVLSANTEVKANSLKELFDAEHKKKGYTVAISSPGAEIAMKLISHESGVPLTEIAYTTSSTAYPDVLGGRVQLVIDSLPGTLPFISSGKLKALAISSESRSATQPNIPTMAKSGLAGFNLTTWNVFYFPAGTPQPIVQKLHDAIGEVLAQADTQKRLRSAGYEPAPNMTLPQLNAFVSAESTKWTGLIKELNISKK